MTSPKIPRRLSPALAEIYNQLQAVAESGRITALVDYLDDLCEELDWVSGELNALGFCASAYLAGRGDGDGHDCPEED
jgi:hypothetical protein